MVDEYNISRVADAGQAPAEFEDIALGDRAPEQAGREDDMSITEHVPLDGLHQAHAFDKSFEFYSEAQNISGDETLFVVADRPSAALVDAGDPGRSIILFAKDDLVAAARDAREVFPSQPIVILTPPDGQSYREIAETVGGVQLPLQGQFSNEPETGDIVPTLGLLSALKTAEAAVALNRPDGPSVTIQSPAVEETLHVDRAKVYERTPSEGLSLIEPEPLHQSRSHGMRR